MKALSQLCAFHKKKCGDLTPSEVAVYLELFMINNNDDWQEWFSAPRSYLTAMTGIGSSNTIARAINNLEQKGYIRVKRGKTKQANLYSIVPLYAENGTKAEQKENNNGTIKEQKENKSGTKTGHSNRVDKSSVDESSSNTIDLLTNPPSEEWGGLTPAEEKVKSAFEETFHPLTKLEDLDALRAYTGDYGAIAVTDAIAKADKSVKDQGRRLRLSPRYLLTILQDKGSGKVAVLPGAGPVSKPDNSWIPRYTTPEEDAAIAARVLAEREKNGFYDYRKRLSQ